jgi:hypothetical protein
MQPTGSQGCLSGGAGTELVKIVEKSLIALAQ